MSELNVMMMMTMILGRLYSISAESLPRSWILKKTTVVTDHRCANATEAFVEQAAHLHGAPVICSSALPATDLPDF